MKAEDYGVKILEEKFAQNKKQLLWYFLLSFSLIFLISFLILFFIEKEVSETKIEALKSQEQRVVKLENDFLGREFSMVLSDLHYLHHAYENKLIKSNNYAEIAENWAVFSNQRKIYDQIRFLDADGMEKIRVNISENGSYIVPDKDLQNKKERYYFTEAINLKEETVYVSPLDLNMEQGKVEIPFKPMIRLSTPVYDNDGKVRGIIVLNYLADYTLLGLRELAKNSQGEIFLLNSNGYSLSSDNVENDWNFMFAEKKEQSFAGDFPGAWNAIINHTTQVLTDQGLVTSLPVLLSHKFNLGQVNDHRQNLILGDGNWYIVSVVEKNNKNAEFFNNDLTTISLMVFKKNMYYFLLMIVVSGIVGLLIYVNRKTYSEIKYYSYDHLTKTLNQRAGITRLNKLFSEDNRRHLVVSLCFIDINGLKEVNDRLGHKMGDELITTVAEVIKKIIREQDFLVRLGGDEFLIVFNGIDISTAENIWKRIIEAYDKINTVEQRAYNISVSHGIVDFENKQKTNVDDLINTADEKMYQEKQIVKKNLQVVR